MLRGQFRMGFVPAGLSLHPATHATNSPTVMARRSFFGLGFCIVLGGERRGSGELSEDNSSSAGGSLWSGRASSLPLFVWVRGTCWAATCGFSALLVSKRVHKH